MIDGQTTLKRLASITNLPTLPIVIDRLNAAIANVNSDALQVAKIVEDDPAIMARVMKVVNSAFYGGQERIPTVQLAVARLGMYALRNIAMSTAVFSVFGKGTGSGFDRQEFWRHSISSGIAAAVIGDSAREHLSRRYSKDAMHLVGLMHDVGKIVYDQFFHDEFAEAVRMAAADGIPLFSAERTVLGMDHTQVGMWLAEKWQLGADMVEVIRWHHSPEEAGEAQQEAVALVHTANYICNKENIGNGGDPAPAYLPGVWKRLGLSVADISEVVDKIHDESKKSEILMSLT